MNGSAVFLFAALKMKLTMAVRRRLQREGVLAPRVGRLEAQERAAVEPAIDVLLRGMDLPDDIRDAARAVSPRRDRPAAARRLLDHFEAEAREMRPP
jgi:hypothetical protein